MKTAVIYARFSCDKQTEQSIEGQIRVCNEFAAKNDIKVVDTYIDRAASGTNDNRVAFQKMLADSEKNPMWDIVLVYAIDRFGRNSIDIAVNKQRLQKNNIILISATQKTSVNIDGSKNLDGIILENVLIGISEYYSVELSQKIRRGQRESRKKGNFLGGHIPYGYRVENKKLLIDDEKAEVLKLIFNLYVSGRYVREILEELNKRGILYNGKPMYKSTLFKLLKNEKYTGVYRYDGEIYDNIYPQIIPTHIFKRVQKMMKKNKIGASSRNTDFILRDKVYCGLCGMRINGDSGTSHNGTKNFYYSCSNKRQFKKCNKKTMKKDELEKLVIDKTISFLSAPEIVSKISEEIIVLHNQMIKEHSILQLLKDERAKMQKSLNNIMQAIEEGIFTPTTKARMNELEGSIAELDGKIAAEETKLERTLRKSDVEAFISEALNADAKTLVNLLIEKIVVYEDKIEISYKYFDNKNPDETVTEVHRDFLFIGKMIQITQRNFTVSYQL